MHTTHGWMMLVTHTHTQTHTPNHHMGLPQARDALTCMQHPVKTFWMPLRWHVQEQKVRAKKRSLLLKVFKTLKAKHEGYLIKIPDAVSMVAAQMGNTRYLIPHSDNACDVPCEKAFHNNATMMHDVCTM